LVDDKTNKVIDSAKRHIGRQVQDTDRLYDGSKASQIIVSELIVEG
jgi:hypothetical protein